MEKPDGFVWQNFIFEMIDRKAGRKMDCTEELVRE
jgi:hypothetical protein